jgi:hypothetical protein
LTSPAEQNEPNEVAAQRTRPIQADRRAARRNADIQRYTVDLDRNQRRTLALWAAEWEVDKSKIVRTLLYLLEADPALRSRVQGELFTSDEGTADEGTVDEGTVDTA